jgi:hypothetical protein
MKSPFPGMDPYLEDYWREVHHGLITYARDRLQAVMPQDLRARVEQRVFVSADAPETRTIFPDVYVVDHGRPQGPSSAAAGGTDVGTAVAEPVIVNCDVEPLTQGYIEIVDGASGNRVVTVIEFLSPSNKVPGVGQDLYLRKQQETIDAGTSLVEIDLTRIGSRVLAFPITCLRPQYRTPYMMCVRRAWKRGKAEVYPVPLQQRLPTIRIPLRQTDQDVTLDVQSLVDRACENGRYDNLNYRAEPLPPLDSPDATWADQWLREKGLR